MQDARKPKGRRKFWFLPRFGLRTVLVLMVLMVAIIAPWASRTRQQIKTCEYFLGNKISFEIGQPLSWLRFLPQSWLRAGGGHWCCPVKRVTLSIDSGNASKNELLVLETNLIQIGSLPRLHEVMIDSWPRIDKQTNLKDLFAPLAKVGDLHVLQFGSCGCVDHLLASLPRLPTLTHLQLSADASLTDAGLETLGKFPHLESLTFTSAFVGGPGLKTVASLPRLREVIAPYSRFGCDDIEHFTNHPTLEKLETSTVCSDDILKVFGTWPHLKFVDAPSSLISDQGLSYLANATMLEEIRIDRTAVSDEGIAHLAECKSLKSIYCSQCKLTDAIGQTLQGLPNLVCVDLRATLVTKDILPMLGNMKHLQELRVNPSIATLDDVLKLAATAPQLQWGNYDEWCSIYTQFNPNVPASTTPSRSLYLPHVKGLAGRIHQAKNFGSIGMASLNDSDANDQDISDIVKSNSQIQELHIAHTMTSMAALKALMQLTSLTDLEIGPFENADEALDVVAAFPSLYRLRIAGASKLTEVGIKALLRMKLGSLTFDDLSYDEEFAEQICMLSSLNEVRWSDKYWNLSQIEQSRTKIALNSPELTSKLKWPSGFHPGEIIVNTEADLQSLKQGKFNYIEISGRSTSKHEIDLLNQVKRCRRLNLDGSCLTDELLQSTDPIPELNSLDLSNNPITDAAVDALLRFENLSTLDLSNTKISDTGLARLIASLGLDHLDVSGTKITEKGLDGLLDDHAGSTQARVRLKRINLEGVAATPQILRRFKAMGLKNLPAEVVVSSNVVLHTNELGALMELRPSNSLIDLAISRDLLNVWTVSELISGKQCLNKLELHDTGHVVEILKAASQECSVLHTLVIEKESLDETTVKLFPHHIRNLSIRDCALNTAILNAIVEACPHLLHLNLTTPMVDCSLEPLLKLSRLTSFTISSTELNAEQLSVVQQLKSTFPRNTIND